MVPSGKSTSAIVSFLKKRPGRECPQNWKTRRSVVVVVDVAVHCVLANRHGSIVLRLPSHLC